MSTQFLPLQLLLLTFAGWVNRQQALMIDYLREENRTLKELLGGKRPRLTDSQRRRLAAKGMPLGRKILAQVATIVTPDTILRWYRSSSPPSGPTKGAAWAAQASCSTSRPSS